MWAAPGCEQVLGVKEKWLSRGPRRDEWMAGIRTQSQILIVLPRKPHTAAFLQIQFGRICWPRASVRGEGAAAVLWLKPAPRKPVSVQRGVVGEQRGWEAAPGPGRESMSL